VCGNERLQPCGWGLRRFLRLKLRRAYCRGCRVRFTFLPVFLAPAKWYPYLTIQRALAFVADEKHRSPFAALEAWEARRDQRLDDSPHRHPGPSKSAVQRWWAELTRRDTERPWLERTQGVLHRCAPSRPVPLSGNCMLGRVLLGALLCLGAVLRGSVAALAKAPRLAVALWFQEIEHGQRCLGAGSDVGRVIPGPSPSLGGTPPCAVPYRRLCAPT
jgi:hypothetical protein